MPDPTLIALMAAGGGLALATTGGQAPPAEDESAAAPTTSGRPRTAVSRIAYFSRLAYSGNAGATYAPVSQPHYGVTQPGDPWNGLPKEAVDRVLAQAEEEWKKLSTTAKRAACEQLKEQFADDAAIQAVDCGSSTVHQIVTVALAAGAAVVCGTACAAGVVVLDKLFGNKVEDWCNDAWDWAKDNVGGFVEDAGDTIAEGAEDVYDHTLGAIF